jgi:hypothetical protein
MFTFLNVFKMGQFSVKRVAGDGNSLIPSPAISLDIVSYYSVLRYLIASAETVLCCAEYNR